MRAPTPTTPSHTSLLSSDLLLSLPRLKFLPSLKTPPKTTLPPHPHQASPTTPPQTSSQKLSKQELKSIGFNGSYLNPPLHEQPQPTTSVPGFFNAGNTCFLAAVLQCLLHSPGFVGYILEDTHAKKACNKNGMHRFCVLCEIRSLVFRVYRKEGGRHVEGFVNMARNIGKICRRFVRGRQEDAHEAVMGIFDGIMRASISGCLRGSGFRQMTSIEEEYGTSVHKVWGGCLKSSVVCGGCGNHSTSYQPYTDLSLDIGECCTVGRALERFFDEAKLCGSNKYRCEKCKMLRNAVKKTSLRRAPLELFVQLKRFNGVRKNCKNVRVDEKISLARYMDVGDLCEEEASEVRNWLSYSLCSVIVHRGRLRSSGHYYAYVKEGDTWLRKDDDRTSKVSFETVCRDDAYLCFYRRDGQGFAGMHDRPVVASKVLGANQKMRGAVSSSHSDGGLQRPNRWLPGSWARSKGSRKQKGKKNKRMKGRMVYQRGPTNLSRTNYTPNHCGGKKLLKRKRANDEYDRDLDKGKMKKVRRAL